MGETGTRVKRAESSNKPKPGKQVERPPVRGEDGNVRLVGLADRSDPLAVGHPMAG